jgi:hypothetical protein
MKTNTVNTKIIDVEYIYGKMEYRVKMLPTYIPFVNTLNLINLTTLYNAYFHLTRRNIIIIELIFSIYHLFFIASRP